MKDKAWEEKKNILEEKVRAAIDYSREYTDLEISELVDDFLLAEESLRLWDIKKRMKMKQEIFSSLRRLDILQSILEDNTVTEVMVNGTEAVYVEREGRLEKWEEAFVSAEKLTHVIQKIVAQCNRTVNEGTPIVDARLKDGSRVNVVLAPVALNGPIVTIRRFPENPITMEQMIAWGSITEEAADFLQKLVRAKYNIFISGGTGSGKTTFLNALSGFIPGDERVITIEDSAELQLQGIPNLVRLETRNENVEGCQAISIRDLIKTALRMRPDRVIVGEVRQSEAIDMVNTFLTGHDGSMSSGHANSAKDMLSRLQTMILMGMEMPLLAVRQQLASAIDIVVHLGRLRDKSRRVLEIAEVVGFSEGEIVTKTLFAFEEAAGEKARRVKGSLQRKGELVHEEKLAMAGIELS